MTSQYEVQKAVYLDEKIDEYIVPVLYDIVVYKTYILPR